MGYRIKHIDIQNYKALDEFHFDFPSPLFDGDPDICILGSRNGVGKTSLLECCAILVAAAEGCLEERTVDTLNVVRGGAPEASINGILVCDAEEQRVCVCIRQNGEISVSPFQHDASPSRRISLRDILGEQPEPIITDRLIYMHSFRKIKETGLNLGMVLRRAPDNRARGASSCIETPLSSSPSYICTQPPTASFKLSVLKYILAAADLFRSEGTEVNSQALKIFNNLLCSYASVVLDKLRPHEDNTIEIMVHHVRDKNIIFPIDGLSSGQKEIISILFMVWDASRKRPHVVLIDEPELHLNAEWHNLFIRKLLEIAPNNRYILATHSEQIMNAVDPDSRVMLNPSPS